MITAKFGGSSLVPQNVHILKDVLTPFHNAVVVSAIGKESANDTKVTDLLLRYFGGDVSAKKAVENKYKKMADALHAALDVEKLLYNAFLRAKKHCSLPFTLSLGEELSARLIADYLSATYVEAQEVVRFDKNGKLLYSETKRRIRESFDSVKLGVIGGFYGGTVDGERATFTRGGSDVTGALCAVALCATLYENWTDVNGLCIADPHKVAFPPTVSHLSYSQMLLLAKHGANVLHPMAVNPLKQCGVPLHLRNFLNTANTGTLVTYCNSSLPVVGVTERQTNSGAFVTTLLHSLSSNAVMSALSEVQGITNVKMTENICKVTSKTSILQTFYNSLVDYF